MNEEIMVKKGIKALRKSVSRNKNNNFILLTIDVEDYFQVENFKPWIPFNTWSSYELRVEKNIHRLLDLFDTFTLTRNPKPLPHEIHNSDSEANLIGARNPIKATFFILGWIAERLPNLVREIHSRGHEVASHGYAHKLCSECSPDESKADLIRSKKLLEDIIGDRVYGYRAPSFAINNDILKIIKDCGYQYDSSYNSFNLHGRYGKISLDGIEKNGIAVKIPNTQHPVEDPGFPIGASSTFYELPISNVQFERLVIPWGGGSYFRIIPFPLFKMGIKTILKKENAYLFYMHPWEIDPEQPRVNGASISYRFRHYINLNKTFSKLSNLIDKLKNYHFLTCMQYLAHLENSPAGRPEKTK
jgi:polysaccharide deacetylase family protein (PEP-CTERM system associated)